MRWRIRTRARRIASRRRRAAGSPSSSHARRRGMRARLVSAMSRQRSGRCSPRPYSSPWSAPSTISAPIEVAPRLLLQAVAVGVDDREPAGGVARRADAAVVDRARAAAARVPVVRQPDQFHGRHRLDDGRRIRAGHRSAWRSSGASARCRRMASSLRWRCAAALIGFAPFNRPVARIFLGDVGSLPIGLLFAWLLVLLAGNGHLAAALLLPLYYLADATLTLLRRIANARAVLAGAPHAFLSARDRSRLQRCRDRRPRVRRQPGAGRARACASVLWPGRLSSCDALGGGAALVGWLLWRFARGKS